jgi:D-alanyl-D-alanine carboxypeptidase
MFKMLRLTALCVVFFIFFGCWGNTDAEASYICSKSAILLNAADGKVLYEQNADFLIPPASVTKILTLYLVFDAIKQGQAHPWDLVRVSSRAANTGGSRMGLRAGREVPLEELIKGIAVVSGNDAAVAVAEHLSGNVEAFVDKMNAKARDLGMENSDFRTPNGLPAKGQLTTARDLAKLSRSYIQHYPEALHIHSMTSYSYGSSSHHNANRLLGACPGVDGIKTGFVCASGFNLSATAKRGDIRLIAVVLGARAPWVRTVETEKLLEAGFEKMTADPGESGTIEQILAKRESSGSGRKVRLASTRTTAAGDGSAANIKRSKAQKGSAGIQTNSKTRGKVSAKPAPGQKNAAGSEDSCPTVKSPKHGTGGSKPKVLLVKQTLPVKQAGAANKSETPNRPPVTKKTSQTKEVTPSKNAVSLKPQPQPEKACNVQSVGTPPQSAKQKPTSQSAKKTDKKS